MTRDEGELPGGTYLLGGDLPVSRLGFGAMRITGEGVWGPPQDRKEAIAVLRRTVELGVTLIDTAESYGPHVSEELIREALYPYREDLVIATKGGFDRPAPGKWTENARPERLREGLDGSLKRLKLERIDLWQLHRVDPKVPADEQFDAIREFVREGKIRHVGLSEATIEQIEQARQYFPVVSVQNRYNMVDRAWEEVLTFCTKESIAFLPWFPLQVGKLASDDALRSIARRHNATPAQIALAWLLQHSPVMLPIPGTSKVKHLEENVAGASLELGEDEMEELDARG